MRKILLLIAISCLLQRTQAQPILPEREQSRVVDELLEERFNTVLPQLMQRTNIDLWLVISREYNEDPILKTMLPSTWLSARRTTMLAFYFNPTSKQVEKFAIARYNVGKSIPAAWDMTKFPDQWDALIDLIKKKDPKKIGVNISQDFGHADGLDHSHYELLLQKLPVQLKNRVVSAAPLAVGWLETRTTREMQLYQKLVAITHEIIAEGFSNRPENDVILPGDLLHVDFGITYLRLNTDIQQHAYVLRPGEIEAPAYLKKAFATSNRLQDILTSQFKTGITGNNILKAAREQAIKEGIKPSIYTHPLGLHGHAAGPTIGLWDKQEGVPGSGDYPVFPHTAYSIELNSSTFIAEWGKEIRIMLEEDGYFDGQNFRYIAGRQEKLRLISYF